MGVAKDSVLIAELRDGIRADFVEQFADLHRFVDRRIAELSAEVHAVVQLMDYGEANISGQLTKVHDQIVSMLKAPAAATRNSGLELEAVVEVTERAANQIMEAAEAIGDWVASGSRDADSVHRVAERINAIFEACSFQDLTGQRIRRAIEHLQKVEQMLGGMIDETTPGDATETAEETAPPRAAPPHLLGLTHSHDAAQTPDLEQVEIDRLLNF
jgi:chemotaxis protein CheZ